MADIVPFPSEQDATSDAGDLTSDSFLLAEGLDLLADFRVIEDAAVRDSIRQLVKSMARSSNRIMA